MNHTEANQFIREVAHHMAGWRFVSNRAGDQEARGHLVRTTDGMEICCSFKGPKYEFRMDITADAYRHADAPANSYSSRHYAEPRSYGMGGYQSVPSCGGTTSLGAKRAARSILGRLLGEQAQEMHQRAIASKRNHDQYVARTANLSSRLGLDGDEGFERHGGHRVEYRVNSDSVSLEISSLDEEKAQQILAILRA